jgi:glutaredoxin 3
VSTPDEVASNSPAGAPGSGPAVVMYATGWCGYCARARALLQSKGVAIQEIDVDAQRGARAEMIQRSGRRTVPQIFIGATHVGGCDDLMELEAAGGLDPLLKQGT